MHPNPSAALAVGCIQRRLRINNHRSFTSLHCSRRFLYSCTTPVLQRFASSAWSGARPSSPGSLSSPTFRPPSQNLLSPFGAVLHGPTRAATATFAEPLDAWLAVLADTVPFYKDCLLICPSTSTRSQVRHVWDRCREHIPTAHVGTLSPRTSPASQQTNTPASVEHSKGAQKFSFTSPPASALQGFQSRDAQVRDNPAATVGAAASPHTPSLRVASSGQATLSASSRPLPALRSPLEDVAPHSLDLVVFAQNVFANEMLFDAPWHLSLAHRALRPHGVVAIVGHAAEAEVVAPDWAATSCTDCLDSVHDEATHDLKLAAQDAVLALQSTTAHLKCLRRAIEVQETLRTAHSDVFFPFPSVRRRWFTSEYAVTAAQTTASFRAAPLYQALYSPVGAMWRCWADYTLGEEKRRLRGNANNSSKKHSRAFEIGNEKTDDSFFVDLSAPSVDEVFQAGCQRSESSSPSQSTAGELAASWSPLGVQRRRGIVDPLDALQALLETHAQVSLSGTSPRRASSPRAIELPPPLRMQMRHFVVTCSSRSMNATPDEHTPRLHVSNGLRRDPLLLSSCSRHPSFRLK